MKVREILKKFGYLKIKNLKRIYKWSPVYYFEYDSKKAVLKKTKKDENEAANLIKWEQFLLSNKVNVVTPITSPLRVEDDNWVIYPFKKGNSYSGTKGLYSAGTLLGKIHLLSDLWHTNLNKYTWPNHNNDSIQKDINDLYKLRDETKSKLNSNIITWLNEHKDREQLLKTSELLDWRPKSWTDFDKSLV